MMEERDKELIIKQSRTIALLCIIILILFVVVFSLAYYKPKIEGQEELTTCGVTTEKPYVNMNDPIYKYDGAKLFKQNCAVCHSSHTDQIYTGPGLVGIANRLPKPAEEWFVAYTLNNRKILRSGDSYAKKLHNAYKETEMAVFEGQLNKDEILSIYNYLTTPQTIIY